MNREQILAILYEMAIVIGGETRLEPLVTKTLQRFLFHTSFPCGLVLLLPDGKAAPDQGCEHAEFRLELSIGDYELSLVNGSHLRIPAELFSGGAKLSTTIAPLEGIPCRKDFYRVFLSLPVDGCGLILLLSPTMPAAGPLLTRIFQPVLSNFAKAIQLCRSNEAYIGTLIADREQAETALHDLDYRNELILDSVGEGICGLDRDGNATFVNPAAATMLGFCAEELVGRPLHLMLHHRGAFGEQGTCPIALTLKEGSRHRVADESFQRKDGTTFPVEYVSTPLLDGERIVGAVVVFQDISARRHLEQEKEKLLEHLLQAQKMEAVGQLAGGIAHDFNNILTVIIGFGTILQLNVPEKDPLRPTVDHVLEAAERAAHLTRSLLAFGRKQTMNPKPESVKAIIGGAEKFLRRVIGEDIRLETKVEGDDLVIRADSGQIEQVLMNLVTNARDAMPDGGRLIIQAEPVDLDDSFLRSYGYGKPGRYVLLSVTDTGMGMDKETCKKIFEPFFTTKERGKGTGLGLAMVYGIVKQHNGYINVYSEPGHGTTFKIFFPLVPEVRAVQEKESLPFPRGGAETILLAEDEAAIRKLFSTTLRGFGYTVIEAQDGNDAVSKYREHGQKIQMLVFDVLMPGKNGAEAYEVIRKEQPGIKVLFLTGYGADMISSKGIVDEGLEVLMKPVSPVALARKVEEMLGK